MSNKNYQKLTNQYYRLTEETYRMLDHEGTDFMNLGIWPAPSISEAQRAVYQALALHVQSDLKKDSSEKLGLVVELGCGWGGGYGILKQLLKPDKFLGINSSLNQIEYCRSNFDSANVRFELCPYENFEIENPKSNTVAIGVESLLHCGNRPAVFKMLQKNKVQRIALAEILLANESARSHRLFQPALSFAGHFEEYPNLFLQFGYDLVVEEDVSDRVFLPWLNALKSLTPALTGSHRKIKAQFIESYSALADLATSKQAKYVLYFAKARGHG